MAKRGRQQAARLRSKRSKLRFPSRRNSRPWPRQDSDLQRWPSVHSVLAARQLQGWEWIDAVIWDFGGVLTSSPFEAFARFEGERGLPADIIRRTNAANHLENAWAKFERAEVDLEAFDELFAAESLALGAEVRGKDVLPLLSGDLRPEMVEALQAHQGHIQDRLHHQQFAGQRDRQRQRPYALCRRGDGAVRPRHRVRPRSACASPTRASTG